MAKAKDLAALAALAGLAYVNRDALFGSKKDDKRTDARSPGDEMSSASLNMPDEEPRIDARSSGDEMSDIRRDVSSGDEMSKYASNYKPPKVSAPVAQSVRSGQSAAKAVASTPTPSDRRNLESGMSRGTVNREEMTKNRAKGEWPDASSRFEGDNYTAVTNARALNEKLNREAGSGTSSGYKADAMKVASRAAAAADARRRAAKQSSYKSGGMTSSASSRADGIATKGKTRGKIC